MVIDSRRASVKDDIKRDRWGSYGHSSEITEIKAFDELINGGELSTDLESAFWLVILRSDQRWRVDLLGANTYKFVPVLLFSMLPPYLTVRASRSFLAHDSQSATVRSG